MGSGGADKPTRPGGPGGRVWDDEGLTDPHGRADKAARVEAMFDAIAPRYALVNRLLSAGRDAYWRRRAVAMARSGPADRVLDLGCGTGDFARAFARASVGGVVGCDFSERMLAAARSRNGRPISWCRADAMSLPFAAAAFDVVSCAFSVRNFQDLPLAMAEIHRVLAPGGRAVILEFSVPRARVLGGLYLFYFRRVLPRLATWISRDRTGAYRYLPASVARFADEGGVIETLRSAGFARVEHRRLTIGVVSIFVAWKD